MRVAGGVENLEEHVADGDLVAVLHVLVLEDGFRRAVQHDRRAGDGGEVAITRDVIGMRVRLEDPHDAQALLASQAHVLVDAIAPGIDDDGLPGLAAADQVGQASRLFVEELVEDHSRSPSVL